MFINVAPVIQYAVEFEWQCVNINIYCLSCLTFYMGKDSQASKFIGFFGKYSLPLGYLLWEEQMYYYFLMVDTSILVCVYQPLYI